MTGNRNNQTKHVLKELTYKLTLSKAHRLFLEDENNIDKKNNFLIENIHPPNKNKEC